MLAGLCAEPVVVVPAMSVSCLVDGVRAKGGVPCRVVCRGLGSHGW